jgi:hypothetical protein
VIVLPSPDWSSRHTSTNSEDEVDKHTHNQRTTSVLQNGQWAANFRELSIAGVIEVTFKHKDGTGTGTVHHTD